jgi:hypothetical protein
MRTAIVVSTGDRCLYVNDRPFRSTYDDRFDRRPDRLSTRDRSFYTRAPTRFTMVDVDIEELKHDSYLTILATAVSYGVLLGIMTVLLFGVPYVLFRFFL